LGRDAAGERVVREIEREESGGVEETGRDVLRISRAKIAVWLAGAFPSGLSACEFGAYALAVGSP
jgi:hypothetical protein